MDTRPNGLHTAAKPVTESEPRAVAATHEEWDEAVAENARRSTMRLCGANSSVCLPRTPVFPAGPPARPYAPYQPATRG